MADKPTNYEDAKKDGPEPAPEPTPEPAPEPAPDPKPSYMREAEPKDAQAMGLDSLSEGHQEKK